MLLQLDGQAFGQVTAADAGGVEVLDGMQHLLQGVGIAVELFAQAHFQARPVLQVAVVVDSVEQMLGDPGFTLVKAGQIGLPAQVFGQAGGAVQIGLAKVVELGFGGCVAVGAAIVAVPVGVHFGTVDR